jgi:hypothetical protein
VVLNEKVPVVWPEKGSAELPDEVVEEPMVEAVVGTELLVDNVIVVNPELVVELDMVVGLDVVVELEVVVELVVLLVIMGAAANWKTFKELILQN